MGRNLTNLFVSESFQYLLQISGSEVTDGLGADVDSLNLTVISSSYATNALSASYAVSASVEIIKEVSSSYADTSGVADSVAFTDITGTPSLLSSSAQIATDISGAFGEVSSSLSDRITDKKLSVVLWMLTLPLMPN